MEEYMPDGRIIDGKLPYVHKNPVTVDGNTYDAFSRYGFMEYLNELKATKQDDYTGDETFVSLGTPRLMTRIKPIAITPEARENMLLVARSVEQACCASVISSAIQCYLAQGKKVQVWAYDKNRLYLTYKSTPWKFDEYTGVKFVEGIHEICDAIYETKQKIRNKQNSDELIILIGMDRICADFEFIEGGDVNMTDAAKAVGQIQQAREVDLRKKGALVESQLDQIKRDTVIEWRKMKEELQGKAGEEGKSGAEIKAILKEAQEKLYAEKRELAAKLQNEAGAEEAQGQIKADEGQVMPAVRAGGEYNAAADFQYIVRQGSRNGYHFMLCLNSYSDLKQTGLKLDLFRHRLAFQVSDEDSREMFGNKSAGSLPEHICQYYDTMERFSFRPYIHREIGWEGWSINNKGEVYNIYIENNES